MELALEQRMVLFSFLEVRGADRREISWCMGSTHKLFFLVF
jgi:hypothetical protein